MNRSRDLHASPLQEQAEDLAGGLPPLQVEAERLASSLSVGVHGRRKAGIGESFWQFRRYGYGDAAAAVDWRQSAKSQHLFVREREWEAAQAVWFWRDASPSMRFKSKLAKTTKSDRASLIALALAVLLLRGGERIAIAGSARPPSAARGSLRRMAHELSSSSESGAALPPGIPKSQNAEFVWLSDFLSPVAETEGALRQLSSSRLSGHFLHIADPAEEDFPYEGRTRFEAVSGSASEMFGRAESVRADYRARFRAHAESIAALARRYGWSYNFHRTDADPAGGLLALYLAVGGDAARRIA